MTNLPNDPNQQPGTQRISHNPTSARVPEKVTRGVTATGFLAFYGQHEFVVDFLQFLARPAQLAARVVMTPAIVEQFLAVLRDSLVRYEQAFGPCPIIPKPQGERPRTPQEIYDDLKIPDDLLSGVYANAFIVGHTPAEFSIDFIATFFPNAVVVSRVYLAAPRIAQLIETLNGLVRQYQQQVQQNQPQIHPPTPPAPPGPPGLSPGIPGGPGGGGPIGPAR